MSKTFGLYFFACLALLVSSCQKEPLISNNDYKTLGVAAHDLLSSSRYTSLRIEVSYMPGYQPDVASLNNLSSFLNTYLNKPEGIKIILQPIAASGKQRLSLSDLVTIEQKNRSEFSEGNTMAVHVLITDADYSDSNDLAISYWNTSICLFGKIIYESSGAPGQVSRTNLMSTLLEHEFGHLLGLVGQGSPEQTPHRDPSNGAHCSNQKCLMYYAVETNTTSNFIPALDAACVADLKANGSR
jgi:hypothetical protein